MAIEVPTQNKIYTKTYNIDKGVDYTNDPSNVWYRRSPSGKNMLPNLDGKPFKRKGWQIKITPEQFRNAAGAGEETEVLPEKVHYFELGGQDYLMFFNNLGMFAYTTVGAGEQLIYCGEYVTLKNHLASFSSVTQGVTPDAQRAFFFEGGGEAGFYVFVGIKLFVFTGKEETCDGKGGRYFHEVDPYVPLVLYSCDPTGAGETYEDINMLTPYRVVQYTCDGYYDDESQTIKGTKVFTVPSGFNPLTIKVELRDEGTGDWKVVKTGFVAANGKISFSTAPIEVIKGEDNLRVTYEPDGQGAQADEKTVTTESKLISVTKTTKEWRTRERSLESGVGPWETGLWVVDKTEYSRNSIDFNIANVMKNAVTDERYVEVQCRDATNESWVAFDTQYHTEFFSAYKPTITVKGRNALFSSTIGTETSKNTKTVTTGNWTTEMKTQYYELQKQTRTTVETKYYRVRIVYTSYIYSGGIKSDNESKTAFSQCSRALVYGNGIINQVFLTASPYTNYNTRVWYSGATDPKYFPELNYFEVGATDKPIMGLLKVGEYLGVIKQGENIDTSVYLAYPTSFEETTVYAVKQNIGGIGAVSNGAFNILQEEPLFLSKEGVMAIEVSTGDIDRQLRNRSYYVNKKLCAEDNLSQAISFVHDGMYILAVNNHCYVLDGSQKTSWENTKTNLQYEAYYIDNIPAQCFCRFHDELWFTDFDGNVCRFYTNADENKYHDDYHVDGAKYTTNSAPVDGEYPISSLVGEGMPKTGDFVRNGDTWYTISEVKKSSVKVDKGVAIDAMWSTIADDDGSVHYFKNLQKKGVVVSLMPSSDSGVDVYVKADSGDPILVGTTDAKSDDLPFELYVRKKVKKYKRLQFICRNNVVDDSFGLDQIIKSYTVGNYSKNKRNKA